MGRAGARLIFGLDPCRTALDNQPMGTGTLTIDLDALVENWRALDAKSGAGTETAATVKADGYGLGAARVARAPMTSVATFGDTAAPSRSGTQRRSDGTL